MYSFFIPISGCTFSVLQICFVKYFYFVQLHVYSFLYSRHVPGIRIVDKKDMFFAFGGAVLKNEDNVFLFRIKLNVRTYVKRA